MRKSQKFFVCKHCGNMIGLIVSNTSSVLCCGERMTELTPNDTDISSEKHKPALNFNNGVLEVTVGSAEHPMEEKHHIAFVYVETDGGGQRKALLPGQKPKLKFCFAEDRPVAVYSYCNLHGLWKTEVNQRQ